MKTLLFLNLIFVSFEIYLLTHREPRVISIPAYPMVRSIIVERAKIPPAPPAPVVNNAEEELVKLICHFESFYPTEYICPAGKRTIGYGFTEKKYLDMGRMTQEQALRILKEEVVPKCRNHIKKYVKVKLNPYQEAALISFTYNCGEGNLAKLVNNPGRLNSGGYLATAKAMLLYCKAKVKGKVVTLNGLVTRRQKEAELFKKA